MAVIASILINQSGKPVGLPSTSRDDLALGLAVTLSNSDNTGVVGWSWEFISKPPSSGATLSTPTSSTSSFVPDIIGSYFIRLTVSDGAVSDVDERIGAIKTTYFDIRVPAAQEETQFDGTLGWANALHTAFLAIDSDATTNLKIDGTNYPTANIGWNSKKITSLANPSSAQDAATKYYVDNSHAATHISGAGTNEIDGDKLDIDWNPSAYTPTTAPLEVTSVDHLTAHLAGIDDYLGSIESNFNGDQLFIDWVPSVYTRTPVAEGPVEGHLAAHLAGIDAYLFSITTGGVGTLDTAYTGGSTITVDSGAVVFDGSTPTTKVIQADGYATFTGDVEFLDSLYGVVLKSSSGFRFRITIDDTGHLIATEI